MSALVHVRRRAHRIEGAQGERLALAAVVDHRPDPAVLGVGGPVAEHPFEVGERVVGVGMLDPDRLRHRPAVAHPRPAALHGVLDAVQELEAGRHLTRGQVGVLAEVETGVGGGVGIGLGAHAPHRAEVGVADRADVGDEPADEVEVGRRAGQAAHAVLHERRQPLLEHVVVVEDVRAVERGRFAEVGGGPHRRVGQHARRQVALVGDVAQPSGMHADDAAVVPAR